MSCTRESNGPVERAEGGKRYQVFQDLQNKAPLGSRESACATGNGVNFRDAKDTGCIRRFSRSGKCRIDAVSIGRDPMSRPCRSEGREVYRFFYGD